MKVCRFSTRLYKLERDHMMFLFILNFCANILTAKDLVRIYFMDMKYVMELARIIRENKNMPLTIFISSGNPENIMYL